MGSEPKAIAELVEAARAVRRVREAQSAYTRELQSLVAEARRTGKSQSHRIGPRVHDYGDSIAALMTALAKYERSAHPPLQEAPPAKPTRVEPNQRWMSLDECFTVVGRKEPKRWEVLWDDGTKTELDERDILAADFRGVAGALQEAPTCDGSGYVHNPETHNGQKRCPGCPACAPPATEPCPCGEGGNPLHVFVHPAPKEPR